MKELKVGGKFYRILTDSVNDIWTRISFWTKASDVQFEDGSYLEGKVFGHSILERNKTYNVGDICYCNSAPSWVRLQCSAAGTTAANEPAGYAAITAAAQTVLDGTATFTVIDLRLATSLSTSNTQPASVGLVKSASDAASAASTAAGKVKVYVGSDGKLHFTNSAGADSALNFKLHDATYTFPANDTGGQKDLGELHKYRYVNATNVYAKGKADGVTQHTGTYTFPSGDSGGTKELGVTHTYRYVNASNVYSKGVSDADARANSSSTNYKTGYNAGVSYADGRANSSSTNYKSGYNAGYSKGVTDADARVNTSSANYQAGVNAGHNALFNSADKIPNLVACLRIANELTFHDNFTFKIVAGPHGSNIPPGFAGSGSSGRMWQYDLSQDWLKGFNYHSPEEAGVGVYYAGFTSPYANFSSPYADIIFYNFGQNANGAIRNAVLYIAY